MAAALAALPEDPTDLRQFCTELLTELSAKQQLIHKLTTSWRSSAATSMGGAPSNSTPPS
jgi:hypothetical protein